MAMSPPVTTRVSAPSVTRALQTPVAKIAPPDNALEREADRTADSVLRGSSTPPEAAQAHSIVHATSTTTARMSSNGRPLPHAARDYFEPRPRTKTLQRQALKEHDGLIATSSHVAAALATRSGAGTPLPTSARAQFEPLFGTAFPNVRIHTDAEAGHLARSIDARAFTSGQNVYFAPGQYNERSTQGRRLLAHELTHTVQQRNSAHGSPGQVPSTNQSYAGAAPSRVSQSPPPHFLIQRSPLGAEVSMPEVTTKRSDEIIKELLALQTKDATQRILGITDTRLLYQLRNSLAGFKITNDRAIEKARAIWNALNRQINLVTTGKEAAARQSQAEEAERRRQERRATRRAERKAQADRLTGKAAPTSFAEARSQFVMARAGATADPTDFAASARILGQVRDWIHPLNSPRSIDKHFGMKGYNKTAASVLVSNCYSEIDGLHDWVRRFVRADQTKPMSGGHWDAAEGALNAAEPYLRTLSGEKRRQDEEMYETTETAGHISGAAMAAAPFVLAGGGQVVSAAGATAYAGASAFGAEAVTLARLVPYFVRDPRLAVTLLRGQVASNPELYYAAFEGLVGTAAAIAEVGGPKKFAEKASTPEGAAQLVGQILTALLTHGITAGGAPRPKTPQPGGTPSETPPPKRQTGQDTRSGGSAAAARVRSAAAAVGIGLSDVQPDFGGARRSASSTEVAPSAPATPQHKGAPVEAPGTVKPKSSQPGKQPSKPPSPDLSEIADPKGLGVQIMTPQEKGLSIEDPVLKSFGFEPVRKNFAAIDGIKSEQVGGQINVTQIKRASWDEGRTDISSKAIMTKATQKLTEAWNNLNGKWRGTQKEFNGSKRAEGADKFGFELPEKWTDESVRPTIIINIEARPPPDKNALEAKLVAKAKAKFGESAELEIIWGTVPDDSVQAPPMSVGSQGQGMQGLDD
jgi:hypothetical protein